MKNKGHRKITQLLALLVFGVFALCVAAVLLTGGRAYQTLTQRGSQANSRRVAVRYSQSMQMSRSPQKTVLPRQLNTCPSNGA